MIALAALLEEVGGLDAAELTRWIEARWVLPEPQGQSYVFHEVDVARVHLIVELRRELLIDDEAMPLVLNLLDQIYALRSRLRAYNAALEALPPDLQQVFCEKLKG